MGIWSRLKLQKLTLRRGISIMFGLYFVGLIGIWGTLDEMQEVTKRKLLETHNKKKE